MSNSATAQIGTNLTLFKSGVITLDSSGGINVGAIAIPFANTLLVSAGGTFASSGVLDGNFENNGGTVSAAPADGTITVNGNFKQDAGGTMILNVSGTNVSSGFDQLNVSGNITMGGTLILNFINGFAPKIGQTYSLIKSGGTVTGSFSQVQTPGLAPGFQFQLSQANGTTMLTAQNNGVATSPPLLSFNQSGTNLLISWLDTATGFTLQSSTNLSSTNWSNLPTASNQFVTPIAGPIKFFRLFKSGN